MGVNRMIPAASHLRDIRLRAEPSEKSTTLIYSPKRFHSPGSRAGPGRTGRLLTHPTPKRIASPPQQLRSEIKRAELLETALELFSLRGFEAVSVREIADAAGSNHAMIRYYFGNKEALWKASVGFLFERLQREVPLPSPEAGPPDLDTLRQWVRSYIRYCARHPQHARLMVQEANRSSERLQWMADTFIRPGHELVLAWLERMPQPENRRQGVEPALWLYLVSAICQAPYLLTAEIRAAHGIDPMLSERIEAHCDAVIGLLYP